MLIFAFFIFSQTVSADGTISGMYRKSFELAEQTYKQSTEKWKKDVRAVEENIGGEEIRR